MTIVNSSLIFAAAVEERVAMVGRAKEENPLHVSILLYKRFERSARDQQISGANVTKRGIILLLQKTVNDVHFLSFFSCFFFLFSSQKMRTKSYIPPPVVLIIILVLLVPPGTKQQKRLLFFS